MVGLRVKNQQSFPDVYTCPDCLLLIRDPIQLIRCGHRFCRSCIDEQSGREIICCVCKESISKDMISSDRGFRNDMSKLIILCCICDWKGQYKDYQIHLDENHQNVICNYCNEKFLSITDLTHHELNSCQNIIVECQLKSFGCENMIPRSDLRKHFLSEQHQLILMEIMRHLKSSENITNYSTSVSTTRTDEIVLPITDNVEELNSHIKRLQNDMFEQSNTLKSFEKDSSFLRKSLEKQNEIIEMIKTQQAKNETDLYSITEKANDLALKMRNGFVWKITNIQEKIGEYFIIINENNIFVDSYPDELGNIPLILPINNHAQSERQTSIDSPTFYSSSTGYKIFIRLYLNGNEDGKQTHLSIYFVLVRSEYDPILQFPFKYKIIFSLYDQTNGQQHFINSLLPDIKMASFQRPETEMNHPIGISKFVPLEVLQEKQNSYIRNDTMFIKCTIDFI